MLSRTTGPGHNALGATEAILTRRLIELLSLPTHTHEWLYAKIVKHGGLEQLFRSAGLDGLQSHVVLLELSHEQTVRQRSYAVSRPLSTTRRRIIRTRALAHMKLKRTLQFLLIEGEIR